MKKRTFICAVCLEKVSERVPQRRFGGARWHLDCWSRAAGKPARAGKRHAGGRPPDPTALAHDYKLMNVKIHPASYESYRERAEARDMTLAAHVRDVLERDLQESKAATS